MCRITSDILQSYRSIPTLTIAKSVPSPVHRCAVWTTVGILNATPTIEFVFLEKSLYIRPAGGGQIRAPLLKSSSPVSRVMLSCGENQEGVKVLWHGTLVKCPSCLREFRGFVSINSYDIPNNGWYQSLLGPVNIGAHVFFPSALNKKLHWLSAKIPSLWFMLENICINNEYGL